MILKLNILLFTAVSAWMDLKWQKVKNFWILTGLAGGVLYGIFSAEAPELEEALAGMILPLIVLGWAFNIRRLGAGDLKLFMTAGLWMGSGRVLIFMLYAGIAGAVYFLFAFLKERDLRKTLKKRICVAVFAFASAVLFSGGVYC